MTTKPRRPKRMKLQWLKRAHTRPTSTGRKDYFVAPSTPDVLVVEYAKRMVDGVERLCLVGCDLVTPEPMK